MKLQIGIVVELIQTIRWISDSNIVFHGRKEEFHLNNCPTNNAFEAIKLTVLVKVNPLLNDKLKFPSMDKSRLKYLIQLV